MAIGWLTGFALSTPSILHAQNAAPVAAAGTLTTIQWGVSIADNPGTAVSQIVNACTDADAGAVKGVAVTAVDETSGKWYFTTNGGSSWTSLVGVSGTAARLLKGNDENYKVRFVPNPVPDSGYTGTASFTFRAWDQTSGTPGATADVSSNGGSTAYSAGTAAATINAGMPFPTASLLTRHDASAAASVISSSGNVSQWNDLSGNGHHFNVVQGTAPTLAEISGRQAMEFNPGKGLYRGSVPLNTEVTVLMAVRYSSAIGGWGNFMHHGHHDNDWSMRKSNDSNPSGKVGFHTNNDNTTVMTSLTDGMVYVLAGRLKTSTGSSVVDFWAYPESGSAFVLLNTNLGPKSITSGDKPLYVGQSDAGEASNGRIGEILYYSAALSDADVAAAAEYLRNKWQARPTLSTIGPLAGGVEDSDYVISHSALLAASDAILANGATPSFRVESVTSGTLTKGVVAVTVGTTLLGPGESLVWRPAANANGSLGAFTVKACSSDGSLLSATASQVTVNVSAVNDAPTLAASKISASRSAAFTVNADGEVAVTETSLVPAGATVVGATLNLEYSTYWSSDAVSGCYVRLNGTIIGPLGWTGIGTSSNFVALERKYAGPLPGYNAGSINTWTFGSLYNPTNLRNVTITVFYEAAGEAALVLNGTEDTTAAFTATMFENAFKDVEGSSLTSIKVVMLPTKGTLKLNGVAVSADQVIPAVSLNALTYEPALNDNGPKTFSVTASDGALASAVATVTVSVAAFNDEPTVSAPASFAVTEDIPGNLVYSGTPFADIDSATLTVTLSVSDGAITGEAGTGITLGGTATARTFSGTVAELNAYFATAGKITYQGALNNTASRTLTTTVSDGSLSASTTSTINFTPVNDAPTLFRDGSSAERAAGSATEIKNGTGTNTNGVYWILVNGVATQVYCIMDSAIDGGGWMLAMKGANTGSTFNYASNHWTTTTTLNAGSSFLRGNSSTVNEDAKFDVFNYAPAEKVMAIFPDVPGANRGGAVSGQSYGFIWIENMPAPTNTTSYAGRPAQGNYLGKTLRELFAGGEKIFIRDATVASPYRAAGPGVFSTQTDVRFFGFNYQNANGGNGWNRARFGFGWNENGGGLYPDGNEQSNDVSGGIGIDRQNWSAGDVIGCCQNSTGLNRQMQFELYVKAGLGAEVVAPRQTPVAVYPGLIIGDPDSAALSSATVSITGGFVGSEDALGYVNAGSHGDITGSYDAAAGVLTLTSAQAQATLAQWQAALRSVTYTNASGAPNTANRTVSFVVNDGLSSGPASNVTVKIALRVTFDAKGGSVIADGATTLGGSIASPGSPTRSGYSFTGWALPNTSPVTDPGSLSRLYSRFKATDYNSLAKVWADSSGNGRNITSSMIGGTPTLANSAAGNGNALSFPVVAGGTGTSIRYTTEILTNYTLFTVARYSGNNRGRIFNGDGQNWLAGFYGGMRGVAHFNSWLSNSSSNLGTVTHWLASTSYPSGGTSYYRADGVERGSGGAYHSLPLLVTNTGSNAEASDYEIAEVLIYDRVLTSSEIAAVERYIGVTYGLSFANGAVQFPYVHGKTSDFTMEAVWNVNSIAVTFDSQGGSAVSNFAWTPGSRLTLPTPTKAGFGLMGWYDAVSEGNKIGDGGAVYTPANTTAFTLYARWGAPSLNSVNTLVGAAEDTNFTVTHAALLASSDASVTGGGTPSFRIESVTSGTLTKNGVAVTAGSTLIAPNESLVWRPAPDANGTLNAFTVKAVTPDNAAASATAVQVRVDVAAVNDAPSLASGSVQIQQFNAGGTFTPAVSGTIEALIVGGGGGGAGGLGGGGGGGGVVHITAGSVVAGVAYPIVVGAGGAAGAKGQASTAFGATAEGGGTGGAYDSSDGTAGGSGGGAAANNSRLNQGGASSGNSLGANTGVIYGNRGGHMTVARSADPTRAAGGGGAGGQGKDTNPNTVGDTGRTGDGSGGVGIANSILGTAYYWGGGGGGGAYVNQVGGYGGLGGGGGAGGNGGAGLGGGSALNAGANGSSLHGGAGGANTGGGGGGGAWSGGQGAPGGSGVVIVRFQAPVTALRQVPVALLPGLSIADVDSSSVGSAKVSITGGFVGSEDILGYVNAASHGNITGSYDTATGVLTLTSEQAQATLAQWQEALRSVTYTNGSGSPNTGTRTVSVVIYDGDSASAPLNIPVPIGLKVTYDTKGGSVIAEGATTSGGTIAASPGTPIRAGYSFAGWVVPGSPADPGSLTGLHSRFKAAGYNATTKVWADSSGNGRNITSAMIGGSPTLITSAAGNGNSLSIPAVAGGTSTSVRYTTAVLPTYTLFTVARYAGSSRGRIFNGDGVNWLAGFHSVKRGVAHFNSWLSNSSTSLGTLTNWLVSTSYPSGGTSYYRADGVERGSGGTYHNLPLLVTNTGSNAEASDYEIAEVLIYDRVLNSNEIAEVERYLGVTYGLNVARTFVQFPYAHGKSTDFTLEAVWTGNSNTVAFDSQGGSAVNNITWTTGSALTLPSAPTRSGYYFNGWYTAAIGGNRAGGAGATYTPSDTAGFTLYAQWGVPLLGSVSTLTGASEDTNYTVTHAALLAASDASLPDNGVPSFRVDSISTGTLTKGGVAVTTGSTLLGPNQSLIWRPATDANGTLNAFTVRATNSDGSRISATAVQVRVDVAAQNDAPTLALIGARAAGGMQTSGGGYMIHTFATDGAFTPSFSGAVEVLVVGGGGGGGSDNGGGGGGGGFVANSSVSVTAGTTLSVKVGAGGSGAINSASTGSNGGDSSFGSITARGGGGGGSIDQTAGADGGSAGGRAANRWEGAESPIATTSPEQGNDGGGKNAGGFGGGGGGGAGGAGLNGGSNIGGNGGAGRSSGISGVVTHYAGGGGGGGDSNTAGTGGVGGGGDGSRRGDEAPTQGTDGLGGGGGGAGGSVAGGLGARGGSGIVIVRYLANTTNTIDYADTGASDAFANSSGALVGTDVDSTTLTYGIANVTAVNGVATKVGTYGTLAVTTSTGAYTFTPDALAINALGGGATASEVFTVTVTDGVGQSPTQTALTVNVTGANDVPTISAIVAQSTNEDTATSAISFTVGDVETAAASLTVTATSSNTSVVAASGISLGGSGANRTITLTPVANASGTSTITVTVKDGANASATANFVLTVNAVNDAPVAANGTLTSIAEDVLDVSNPGTSVAALAANFTDPDSVAVRGIAVTAADEANGKWFFSTNGGGTWVSLTGVSSSASRLLKGDDANHKVRFVPNKDFNGTATFTYRAWDQTSGEAGGVADVTTNGGTTAFSSATGTATITVTAENDAPTLAVGAASASGGTQTNVGGYTIHTFTENGTFTITGSGVVEVLVVAGGGGGGGGGGGAGGAGGGAGGVIYNSSFPVSPSVITVTVGAGGAGGPGDRYDIGGVGRNGSDSTFSTLTAIGGGGGGAREDSSAAGSSGGSGGGGGVSGTSKSGGSGTPSQGNAGGANWPAGPNYGGGGGGGAGGVGQSGLSTKGGDGGIGLQFSISGTATYYGGGGGASFFASGGTFGAGGLGGGGGVGVNGTPNTGGGGGGGAGASSSGAAGGSGIVIVRYLTNGLTAAPTYADTAATDTFAASTGTLVGADVDANTTLTYGISGGTAANGVVSKVGTYGTLAVTAASGAYTFTPNAAAINALSGAATEVFTVSVSDGTATTTTSLVINLTGVNDAPTLVAPAALTYTDTAANDAFANGSGTLRGADVDTPGAALTYGISGVTPSSEGIATKVGSYGTLTVTTSSGAFTFTPNRAAINALIASASESYTVTVSDGTSTATANLVVNLTAANDAPVLGGATTYISTDFSSLPSNATLYGSAAISNGQCILTPPTSSQDGFLIFAPIASSPTAFTAQFNYRAADGTGADGTSFNYGPISLPPAGNPYGMSEYGVKFSNDTGLSVRLVEFGVQRVEVVFNGSLLASAEVPLMGSAYRTVQITVDGSGRLAVSVAGATVLSNVDLGAGYGSADKTDWSFGFASRCGGLTNQHSLDDLYIGALPAVLQEQMPGVVSNAVTVADADNVSLASATVKIAAGLQAAEDRLGFTNIPGSHGNIAGNYNAATGTLTLTSAQSSATLAQWEAALRAVTYTNISDAPSGANRTVSFAVNDGSSASNTLDVRISVLAINDAPTATAQGATTNEDTPVAVTLAGSDPEGSVLTYAVVNGPTKGSLSGTAPNLTYTPAANSNGTDSFTYKVNDGAADSVPATVTITVIPVNDAPTLAAPAALTYTDTLASDVFYNESGSLQGADVDSLTLTYGIGGGTESGGVMTKAGAYGSLAVTVATGAYTFTPNAAAINALAGGATASDDFAVFVTDGLVASPTMASLKVNVTGANDAPTLVAPAALSYADTAANDIFTNGTGSLQGGDVDTAGSALTYGISDVTPVSGIATKVGTYGSLAVTVSTGAYTFTPNATAINALSTSASENYTVTVNDGTSTTNAALTINVLAANDSPFLDLDADNSSGAAGADNAITYTVSGKPVALVDSDVTVTDPDSTHLQSATITLTNAQANDVLAVATTAVGWPGAIAASVDTSAAGKITVVLSNPASKSDYAAALRLVTFSNSNLLNPSMTNRIITVKVSDGSSDSNVATTTAALAKATPVVTVTPGSYTYTGFAQGPGSGDTKNSGDGLSYTFSYAGTAGDGSTYVASPTPPTSAGSYTVTATVAATANWNSANSAVTAFTINPAALTVTAVAQSKTYGSTAPTAGLLNTHFTVTGLQNSDTAGGVTLGYSGIPAGNLPASAVGGYTITPSALVLASGLASNYTITYNTGTLTVNAATLTITANNDTKVYGGTKSYGAGSTGYTSVGLVAGETIGSVTLTASGGTGVADGVGGYDLTPSAATGGTFNAANYTIGYVKGTLTVTAAVLTGSFTANHKVYDGTTAATVGGRSLSGVVGSDEVQLTGGTATFDTKEQGTGKTVTLAGATLGGAKAGNYTLGSVSTTTANITAKELTITGLTVSNKVYDGLVAAGLNGTPALSGVVGTEDVKLAGTAAGAFNNANVGVNKPVAVTGLSLEGTAKGNYTLTLPTLAAEITKAPLTVKAEDKAKTYDGAVYAGGYTVTYVGFVPNETAAVLGGALTYGGGAVTAVNAGSHVITPAGLTSGNYDITYADGALTINRVVLTVTAENKKRAFAAANPAFTHVITGFVNNENVAVVSGSPVLSTTAVATSPGGKYPISILPGTLSATNYSFTLVAGELTVEDNRPPTITSNGGGATATAEVFENATAVTTVAATDPEGQTIAYAISGGADAAKFTVNETSGALVFKAGPDFETPASQAASNVYTVVVQAKDAGGASSEQTLTITVRNVNEAPAGADKTVGMDEDATYALVAADFGFSDVDAGTKLKAVVIATLPAAGTLKYDGTAITSTQLANGYEVSAVDIAAGKLVFAPAANAFGTSYASFTFQVRDDGGVADGGVDLDPTPNKLTIEVKPVNDLPVVATSPGATAASEQIKVVVDGALTVTDVDNPTLASALVTIAAGFARDQDVLGYESAGSQTHGNITGSYNAASGVLTLTSAQSTATVGQWQAALRAVTYTNTSDAPSTADRTVSFVLNDGSAASAAATKTVTVAAVNDAPVLAAGKATLTRSSSFTVDTNGEVALTETSLVPAGAKVVGVTLNLEYSTYWSSNEVSGCYVRLNGVTFSPLGWTGLGTSNNFVAVERKYAGALPGYNAGSVNTWTFGSAWNPTNLRNVTITVFYEAAGEAALVLNGTEDTTVSFIAGIFENAFKDVEGTPLVNIKVVTLPATGRLKLNGAEVVVDQVIPAANLSALTYEPATNDNGTKTFTVVASDGELSSSIATVTINVAAVNDAPIATASSGNTVATVQTPVVVDPGLTVTDVDSVTLASATVAISSGFQGDQDALGFANAGAQSHGNISGSFDTSTGVLTLVSAQASATLDQWQAALRAVTFSNSSNTPNVANRTISYVVNDGGLPSAAAAKTFVPDYNRAPAFTVAPAPVAAIQGNTVFLSASVSGWPTPTLQWRRNGVPIEGATRNILVIHGVIPSDAGSYDLVAANVVQAVQSGAVALTVDVQPGELFGAGLSEYGSLGDLSAQGGVARVARQLWPAGGAEGLIQVAAAGRHSLILTASGKVYGMGHNFVSALGIASNAASYPTPELILDNVRQVAAAQDNSYFLRRDGTLWGVGTTQQGMLGEYYPGAGSTVPFQLVPGQTNIVGVWAGGTAGNGGCIYLTRDGQLFLLGGPSVYAPLRLDTGVVDAAQGAGFQLWVKTDGSLWAQGNNTFGQLGTGGTTTVASPQKVADDVARVFAGSTFTFFIKRNGSLWAAGRNTFGQLGIGSAATFQTTPAFVMDAVGSVACGERHAIILKIDGSVWTTGNNYYGQLGDGTSDERRAPVPVASGAVAVAAGAYYTLHVAPVAPTIIVQPEGKALVAGGGASLSVVAAGTPMLRFQWKRDGVILPDGTLASLTLAAVTASQAGSYVVEVTNARGSAISAAAVVTVDQTPTAPSIVAHPAGLSVKTGAAATFTVRAAGTGTLGYQWRRNEAAIAGATSATLTLPTVQFAQTGLYDVVVTNAVGSATSAPAPLTLLDMLPPVITRDPVAVATTPGQRVEFSVDATGTDLRYQWRKDSVEIPGATARAFTLTAAGFADAGAYSVAVSNDLGRVFSATAQLRVDSVQGTMKVVGSAGLLAGGGTITLELGTNYIGTAPVQLGWTLVLPPGFSYAGGENEPEVKPYAGNTGSVDWAYVSIPAGSAAFRVRIAYVAGLTGKHTFFGTVSYRTGGLPTSVSPAPVTLVRVDSPTIIRQPAAIFAVAGTTASFSIEAQGGELVYQWFRNGQALQGATSPALTFDPVRGADAGDYMVRVSNPVAAVDSNVVKLTVFEVVAEHAVQGPGYVEGQNIEISNTITYSGGDAFMGWQVLLPKGWTFVGSSGDAGDVRPVAGTSDLLEWAWTSFPVSPVKFSYVLKVPEAVSGRMEIAALLTFVRNGKSGQVLAKPDPLKVERVSWHSADLDRSFTFSLFELLRVIELYNTRRGSVRTGAYRVGVGTEDGFETDFDRASGVQTTLSAYHSADYGRDGAINLLELLRMIELYNFSANRMRTGQFHRSAGTEDGFAPGPSAGASGGSGGN